ncbi:MAG: GEVED domain-containing protein, partial [Bacteroidota bacterium]
YHDYTALSTNLNQSNLYTISVKAGYASTYATFWIDYNHNNTFDAGEIICQVYCGSPGATYNVTFTPPLSATLGTTVLRAMTNYGSYNSDPCASLSYGNCSDFTVNITAPVPPPTITTTAATGVTSAAANLNGIVNANGTSTTPSFNYGLTVAYGNTAAASPSPVTGSIDTPVSASISGLSPNTTYHYRATGTNVNGTYNGGDMTFTTNALLPTVTTQPATSVSGVSAQLNGIINPNNAATTVKFAYGLTTAYGDTITGTPSSLTGVAPQGVMAGISGLSFNTTYHFKALGTNIAGTQTGTDLTFTTLPTVTCIPVYSSGCGTGWGLTNFALGSISQAIPCTGTPSYYHDYTASTTTDLIPNNSYTITMSGNYQNLYVTVWIDLNHNNIFDVATEKLGNAYCYSVGYTMGITIPGSALPGPARLRIMARDYNVGYPTDPCSQTEILGNCADFTVNILPPGPPLATTNAATNLGGTIATLNGVVNPDNLSTTVTFDYGLTIAYGNSATGTILTGGTNQNVYGYPTGLLSNTIHSR